MKIGGLQKVSLIDYPGKICAIIFSQGCNFRCSYCHNPELVDPAIYGECQSEEEVFSFLKKRRGKLDAVTITGGEPTIQNDLVAFVRNIKALGYLVKIDTNGSNPEVMNHLITKKLVDYIAMDVKGPMRKYRTLTRSQVVEEKILQSIATIMASGIPYEFRTTIVKSQLNIEDLLAIGKLIKNARLYVLQQFVSSKTLDQSYIHEGTYTQSELEALKKKLMKDISDIMIR